MISKIQVSLQSWNTKMEINDDNHIQVTMVDGKKIKKIIHSFFIYIIYTMISLVESIKCVSIIILLWTPFKSIR